MMTEFRSPCLIICSVNHFVSCVPELANDETVVVQRRLTLQRSCSHFFHGTIFALSFLTSVHWLMIFDAASLPRAAKHAALRPSLPIVDFRIIVPPF